MIGPWKWPLVLWLVEENGPPRLWQQALGGSLVGGPLRFPHPKTYLSALSPAKAETSPSPVGHVNLSD